jgi:ATP-dependent DNA helicase RecG
MSFETLEKPVEFIKGVGPAKATLLNAEMGIRTLGDLLAFYPFRYVDRSRFYAISDISSDSAYIQIKGKIDRIQLVAQKKGKRLVATFSDSSGTLELIWFNSIKWMQEFLKVGTEYVVFGKPGIFKGKASFVHPEIDTLDTFFAQTHQGLVGVYPGTDKLRSAGLDSRGIRKIMRIALDTIDLTGRDFHHDCELSKYGFISRSTAMSQIHFPSNPNELASAEKRIKFDEFLVLQMKLGKIRAQRKLQVVGRKIEYVGDDFGSFYHHKLPYELTGAQKRVLKEIRTDLGSGKQMNRLLQGDVGSGKTVVSLMAMLMATGNQLQACLMAPTEILATQHFQTISSLLDDMEVRAALLTGSTPSSKRSRILQELKNGEIHILIGTHALIEDPVIFKELGFVVIDEQHRFGVEQRYKLWSKSTIPPHVLVMTATPIPRTLAMTLYGDLDISVIDELPPGRKPIVTAHRYDYKRFEVYEFIRKQIQLGRQAYIVFPLIEESETLDYKNLMDGYDMVLSYFPLPQYQVSVLHGRLKPVDKEFEMQRFVTGITNIMVATTVIEVGVNVPNASVMVIESAERFGLSQLHQLRGRVGRGADQSFCILMTGEKLSADAKKRINTMVETNDGFKIAEVDLQLRGPGDIEGTRQSGLLELRLASLTKDQELLVMARQAASEILEADPTLEKPEHLRLAAFIKLNYGQNTDWSRIS